MSNLDKYGENEVVEIPALSLVHVLTTILSVRSFLLSVASSIGGSCGRALVCGHLYWCSGLSSASVRYSGFAIGLRCWRKCAVTRWYQSSCALAHLYTAQRTKESLYIYRRSDWIMHLYILAQQSAHPIPSQIQARWGPQADWLPCTLQYIDQKMYQHVTF